MIKSIDDILSRTPAWASSRASAAVGVAPEQMRQPERMRQVAQTLHAIHAMPPIHVTFSPFWVVESCADLARGDGLCLQVEYRPLLEMALGIERASGHRLMLAVYFGGAPQDELARLRLLKAISEFRDPMWAVLQFAMSKLDVRAHARCHLAKIQSRMADAGWNDRPKEVVYAS
jgi:hypothetical protein